MARPVQQFVDYCAAEPIRVLAILRLPMIGLIAVLVWIWEVDHWLPGLYAVILGVYAVAAVLWLVTVLKGPVPRWGLGVDGREPDGDHHAVPGVGRRDRGAAAGLLPAADLGGLPGPADVDGDHRTVTALGYLAVWIFYSERDDMQTLLAARLELDEARERNPDPALDMVYAALQETATGLRSTVTELHPQVLVQLGLTPTVRELLRQFESRTDLAVEAELKDEGKPESQALLYRAARELLTNVGKHAKATTVCVGLMRKGDRIVLTIDDDGAGFDPAIVAQYVADGHIGVGSLLARFDARGGAMEIHSRIGYDTQVTATSPREPVASSGE